MSTITSPQSVQAQKSPKRHNPFKKKQQIPVIPPEDASITLFEDSGESSSSSSTSMRIPISNDDDDVSTSSLSHSYNEAIYRNPSPTKPPKTSRFHRKKKESMPSLILTGDDETEKTSSYPKPTNGVTSARKKSRKSAKNKYPLPLTPVPTKSQRKPGTISQILSFPEATEDSSVSFSEPSIFSTAPASSTHGSNSLNSSPASGPVIIPGIRTPPCMNLENEFADTGVFVSEIDPTKKSNSTGNIFSDEERRKTMSVPLESEFDDGRYDYSSSDDCYSDESTPAFGPSSSSGMAIPRFQEDRLMLPSNGGISESSTQISARGYNSGDYVGLVHLLVVDGMNIPRKDHIKRSSSPFIVIRYGDSVQNTSIIRNNLAPVWMETYNFLVKETSKSYVFRFDMYNWEHTKNRFIGAGEVECKEIWDDGEEHNYIIPLFTKKGKDAGIINVKIKMRSKEEINQMFWWNVIKQLENVGPGTLDKLDIAGIAELLDGSITSDEIDRLIAEEGSNVSQVASSSPSSSLLTTSSSSSSSSSTVPMGSTLQGRITHQAFIDWVTRSKENTLKMVFEEDIIWKLSVFIEDENDASVVLKDTEKFIGAPAISDNVQTIFSGKLKKMRILVKERLTGQIIEEKIGQMIKLSMRIMYSNVKGRKTISNKTVRRLLCNLTNSQGKSYDHPKSAKQIPKFIKYHKLDMSEYEGSIEDFKNFNQFFYRKLKPGKRPIDHPADPKIAISPADCRMSLFSTIDSATEIWIKGKNFSLENLLQDSSLASEFSGGSIVVARLAPQDYHVNNIVKHHIFIFYFMIWWRKKSFIILGT